jgi:predicted O-methyltransferase YrrM
VVEPIPGSSKGRTVGFGPANGGSNPSPGAIFLFVREMETEDRFTKPTNFCPHPEYWHSPDSEATEIEVSQFIGSLVRVIQPEFVLETGTYHGHTAFEIAGALSKNGHGEVHSIEANTKNFNQAKLNLDHYSQWEDLTPLTIFHMNTMKYTPPKKIDFAFFDSWQEGRHEEFLRYHAMGKLLPGAIVAFHDSAPHHQVLRLVEEYLIDEGYIKAIQFFTPRGLLLGQVIKQ